MGATTVATQQAQAAGIGGAAFLVAAAAVAVIGGWTAAVQLACGAPWSASLSAGLARAKEEMTVKAAALAAEHALVHVLPHPWVLPVVIAFELRLATRGVIRRHR